MITYRSQKGSRLTSDEVDGNFEYLASINGQANAIIEDKGFIIESGIFKANPNTIWIILGVQYTNTALVEVPIALASTGMQRFYRIVLNTNNTFQIISGDESDTSPAVPNKENDQLDYTLVLVDDASIGTPTTPIIGDAFVKKIYSGGESSFISGSDVSFPLPANGKSFLSFTNPLLTSLSGFNLDLFTDVLSDQPPYEGKDFLIYNNKNTTLTLKHYDDINALIWFKLTNDTDIEIPAFGLIHIKYFAPGSIDLYKSWISGGVQSVVAGTNVSVDNTDPLNPIVSAEQDLQSVLDVNGYAESTDGSSYVYIDLENGVESTFSDGGDNYAEISSLSDGRFSFSGNKKIESDTKTELAGMFRSASFMFNIFSEIKTIANTWLRKTKLNFLESGLKISSRSDGSEIGVILKTDNLTVDRKRQEQDKDGTYALVEDGYIPLKGTEIGNPVTGDIKFEDSVFINLKQGSRYIAFTDDERIEIDANGVGFDISDGSLSIRNPFGDIGIGASESSMGLVADYYYGANYNDNTYVQKKYVDDNFASNGAIAKTGTALTFTSSYIYGTFTTPSTTNITVDLTGATLGIVQKMYHQNGTTPTFPDGFVKISGTYSTVGKNIIYFEFSEGTRVEYWIVNI